MTKVDPLTLAVIQAALQQVCNEMDLAFSRSAFSPVIAEADDRSSGIYDRHSGALISQGEMSPMGLLWRMVAFSPLFQLLAGIAECGAGLALLWRRSVPFGAGRSRGARCPR